MFISGGLLTASCPHGIVYGIKFLLRGESPRDHIDLLLSLKHQPTVTICDIPGFVSRHGNKRKPGMFSPHDGRFAEPNESNIQAGQNGHLQIDLPELNLQHMIFSQSVDDHQYTSASKHPLMHTTNHYCGYDRFHQDNSKVKEDRLRRLDIVTQFKGKINSQVAEELFANLNKSRYFLTQLKPRNHIFLVRLILHLQNMRRNQERLQRIMKATETTLSGCTTQLGPDNSRQSGVSKSTTSVASVG